MGNPTPEIARLNTTSLQPGFAGAGKGNFQLPDTAAVSPFL